MTYPKPIPIFTPEAFREAVKKATKVEVSEKEKEKVNELQEEL